MKISRRVFLANLAAAGVSVNQNLLAFSPPKKIKLLLNSAPAGPLACFYVAKEKGYFAQAGLEVELVGGDGAAAVVPRIMPEGFDGGYGDLNALIDLVATDPKNAPIAVYIGFNTTPLTIAVAANGPIKTPKDLENQTIGGHPVDAALKVFPAFAQRAGIDASNIKFARSSVSMYDLVKDTLAGKTAGTFGFVNTITAACSPYIDVKKELRFIEYRDFTPELCGNTLMMSPKFIKENPKAVAALVRAVNLGLRDTIADVDMAMDAVEKNSKTLRKDVEKIRLIGTIKKEMSNPEGKTLGMGDVSVQRLNKAIALIANSYPLPRIPASSEVFTREFLPTKTEKITLLAQNQRVRFLLNSGFTGAQAWFHRANEQKYFGDLNIEYTQGMGAYTAAPRIMPEGFDMAYGDINSLIEVASKSKPNEAPIAAFVMFNASPSTIVVAADGAIKNPQDLEGKKLIGHGTDVALNTFPVYAQLTKIDVNKVTIEPSAAGMGDLLKSVLSGKFDGMFGYVTTITAAAKSAGIDLNTIRFIRFDEVLKDFYGSAVMVNPRFLADHPEVVKQVIYGINKGLMDSVKNPKLGIDALKLASPDANEAIELGRLTGTFEGEMSHPEGKQLGIGDVDLKRLERSIQLLANSKKLARVPSVSEIFTSKALPPSAERVRSLGK